MFSVITGFVKHLESTFASTTTTADTSGLGSSTNFVCIDRLLSRSLNLQSLLSEFQKQKSIADIIHNHYRNQAKNSSQIPTQQQQQQAEEPEYHQVQLKPTKKYSIAPQHQSCYQLKLRPSPISEKRRNREVHRQQSFDSSIDLPNKTKRTTARKDRNYFIGFSSSFNILPAMSAPPINSANKDSDNYNNNNNNNNNNNYYDRHYSNSTESIPIHFSLPTEPITSDRQGSGAAYESDMSLQSSITGNGGNSRYQSLNNNNNNNNKKKQQQQAPKPTTVHVNRPQSQQQQQGNGITGASSSSSSSFSSLRDNGNNSIDGRYNNMGDGNDINVSGKSGGKKSPFIFATKGNQSPISSILSSGSRILQQSMRAINVQPGSLRASTFTVITAMVGGGTLTIPYGIKMAGTLAGFIYLVLACIFSGYSTWALIYCAEKNNCRSYRKLAKKLYGDRVSYFIQAMLMLLLWCVCVSYMTLTKELLSKAMEIILSKYDDNDIAKLFTNEYFLLILCVIIIVLPLALMRKVSALRYASLIGVCVVIFTCGLVTVLYFEWCEGPYCAGPSDEGSMRCEYDRKTFFKSFSYLDIINPNILDHSYTIAIMIGGYADHPTVLPIYFEMQRRSPSRMKKCLVFGFLIVLLLYVDIAYFGYFTFPTHIQQNLLLSNYRHNPVMLVTAAMLCLYVISIVPLFAHAFRKTLAEILIEIIDQKKQQQTSNENKKTLLTCEDNIVDAAAAAVSCDQLLNKNINNKNENKNKNKGGKPQKKKAVKNIIIGEDNDDSVRETREMFEHAEVGIAFMPAATPETQKKLRFEKPKRFNKNNNDNNNNNNNLLKKNNKSIQNEDSDSSFESADSFELDEDNINNIKKGIMKKSIGQEMEAIHDPFQLPTKLHAIVTLTFIFSALLAATFAPNIGTVNALIGSTSLPLCCFMFPAMCAWRTPQASDTMRYTTIVLAILIFASSAVQLTRQAIEWS